jgi:hypothetical protein
MFMVEKLFVVLFGDLKGVMHMKQLRLIELFARLV